LTRMKCNFGSWCRTDMKGVNQEPNLVTENVN
jgi:hypothetical protein